MTEVNLSNDDKKPFEKVSNAFQSCAEWLHKKKAFTPEMLSEPEPLALMNATHDVLAAELGNLSQRIPQQLTHALDENIYLFSGFKTYHQMNDCSRLLKGDDGGFKPFDKFLQDVLAVDAKYNRNYLYAEYNFAVSSTQMAVKWHEIEKDGDDYDLQYRTAGDEKVREEHQALDGTTLPPSDKFWNEYYPPNGWNCRCTAVQVRKGKYPQSDSDKACAEGEKATTQIGKNGANKAEMFRFNPGKAQKVFPPKHPYYKAPEEAKKKINAIVATAIIRTQSALERESTLKEMERFIGTKVTVNGNGHQMKVGFSKKGNKHLYSDTFSRSKILLKEDLKHLDNLFDGAVFVKKSALSKKRTDGIKRFYYYETILRGNKVYLNVAETDYKDKHGMLRHSRFLYSVTDKLK